MKRATRMTGCCVTVGKVDAWTISVCALDATAGAAAEHLPQSVVGVATAWLSVVERTSPCADLWQAVAVTITKTAISARHASLASRIPHLCFQLRFDFI